MTAGSLGEHCCNEPHYGPKRDAGRRLSWYYGLVEHTTNGRLSVRKAHHDVIADAPMGISNLFLAVCSASTPEGVVTSPAGDMTAYIIAPGQDLGCVKAEWA